MQRRFFQVCLYEYIFIYCYNKTKYNILSWSFPLLLLILLGPISHPDQAPPHHRTRTFTEPIVPIPIHVIAIAVGLCGAPVLAIPLSSPTPRSTLIVCAALVLEWKNTSLSPSWS